MPVYKASFEVHVSGFLVDRKISGTELYEAKNIMLAKKQAEAYIQKAKEEFEDEYVPLLTSKPVIVLKDIQKVED